MNLELPEDEARIKTAKRRSIIFLFFFFTLLAVLGLLFLPFMREMEAPEFRETFSSWVNNLGFRGVLLFFGLQLLQNVIAFIPGGPMQVIAGAAFGTWKGLLILQAGVTVAAVIIFAAVKKIGSSLITRLLGADVIETWSFLKNDQLTSKVTFILFLITGVPKDALTYIAALTKFKLRRFLPISLVARFPGMLLSTMMGDAAMQGKWWLFILIFGFTGTIGVLSIHFKDRILKRYGSTPKTEDVG